LADSRIEPTSATVGAARREGQEPNPRSWRAEAAVSVGLWGLLLLYVTSFWGRAGRLLPPPFDNWHYLPYRTLTRLSGDAQQLLRGSDALTLYAGVEAYLLGLLVPTALLVLIWRRPLAHWGLRWPDRIGWRWTIVGTALAVPAGLWITALVPPRGNELAYVVMLLSMVPEHVLICGIGIALLLPERKLPDPHRAHWSLSERTTPSLATLLAIAGSTALFVAVHVGAHPAELAFSVLTGSFFAYLTWRTASVWPALLSHWSLNLAPLAVHAMR